MFFGILALEELNGMTFLLQHCSRLYPFLSLVMRTYVEERALGTILPSSVPVQLSKPGSDFAWNFLCGSRSEPRYIFIAFPIDDLFACIAFD